MIETKNAMSEELAREYKNLDSDLRAADVEIGRRTIRRIVTLEIRQTLSERGEREGFVSVPVELPQEMLNAAAIAYQDRYDTMGVFEATKLAWAAALDARPEREGWVSVP